MKTLDLENYLKNKALTIGATCRWTFLHGKAMPSNKKTLHLTMITSESIEHNEGWHTIQSELTLYDLFC